PAMLDVPDVVGLTETQAQFAIEQAGFTYDPNTTTYQFSDVREGDVLAATDGQGGPLPEQMAEQQPIRLVVSAGIVPDVVGYGQSSAVQQLEDVGLKAEVAASQYSETVPEGNVIAATTTTDPVRPGDTINLTVSLGPEPTVQVPNVVGKTVSQAVSELEAAGFTVDHKVAPPLVGIAVVTAQTPKGDAEVKESEVENTTVQLTVR
ncbi:MAG: PASTA domain-containing protein, partial [Pseudoclavibacter sp.]